ncbi:MAG: hypothetical protein WBQ43_05095 [Terriglobales bacterium]
MKLLCNVGAVASFMFIAVGLFWLWKPGIFGAGQIICILGLSTGMFLCLGLYVFQLRDRIALLEKDVRESR